MFLSFLRNKLSPAAPARKAGRSADRAAPPRLHAAADAGDALLAGRAPLACRPPAPPAPAKLSVRGLDFWYGEAHALKAIDLDIPLGQVTAFIGPSGCGKSTLLKCLNRMQDDVRGARHTGQILLRDENGALQDIHAEAIDPPLLRQRFGWVAQKPNPFPDSIYDNLAYPASLRGRIEDGPEMRAHVEDLMRRTGLWDELGDRLDTPGTALSGGQQQRLCIARALSGAPEVLLMDEPCGSLDPISTERVEQIVDSLRGVVTVVLITHNMEQAARVADHVAFFELGRVLEVGDAAQVLTAPRHPSCRDYLAGRFG